MKSVPPAPSVKKACRKLAQLWCPSEMTYFEATWSAVMGSLGLKDFSKATDAHLQAIRERLSSCSMNTALRSALDTRLDYSILVVMASVLEIRALQGGPSITLESISRQVQAVIERSDVPSDVAPLLSQRVPPLIAEICGVELPGGSQRAVVPIVKDSWYMEWRFPGADAPKAGYMTSEEIDRELRKHSTGLDLLLDERKVEIVVRGWTRCGYRARRHRTVELDELPKRYRVMLGLILRAIYDGGTITYDSILRRAYGTDRINAPHLRGNVRRMKSDLDNCLDRIFKNVVKAARGLDQYKVVRCPFFYCWIRPDKDVTALFKETI